MILKSLLTFTIFLTLTFLCHRPAIAQLANSFTPLKTYTKSSTEIIETMRAHFTGELNAMYAESPNEFVLAINKARLSALLKFFKNQEIVNDAMLEEYVSHITFSGKFVNSLTGLANVTN
jgi:hypothetical protein